LFVDTFCLRKRAKDPHILAHVNTVPDDGYTKLKICTSELILYSHEYTPVAYVTMYVLRYLALLKIIFARFVSTGGINHFY